MRTLITLLLYLFLTSLSAQIGPFQEGKVLGPTGSTKDQVAFITHPFGQDRLLLSQESGRRVSFYRFDGTTATEILRGTHFSSVSVIAEIGAAILLETVENGSQSRLSLLYSSNNALVTLAENITNSRAYEVAHGQRYCLIVRDLDSGEDIFLSIDSSSLEVSDLAEAFPENGVATSIHQGGGLLLFRLRDNVFATDGLLENTLAILPAPPLGIAEVVNTSFGIAFSDSRNLYVTDGTPESTRMINDPASSPDQPANAIRYLTPTPGGLTFTGVNSANEYNAYYTDGTSTGTRTLRAFPDKIISNPSQLIEDSLLLFRVYDQTDGKASIWQSDGSVVGTKMVWEEKDTEEPLSPNVVFLEVNSITSENKISYIHSSVENTAYEFYLGVVVEDGIRSAVVVDSVAYSNSSGIQDLSRVLIGDWLFLQNNVNLPNQTQVRFNGGVPTYEFGPGPQPVFEKISTTDLPNGSILLPVYSLETGREPGFFDPINGQLNIIEDINTGTNNSEVSFFDLDELAYFVARSAQEGYAIYRTDGTSEGTVLVDILHNRQPTLPLKGFVNVGGFPLVKYGNTWGMIDSVASEFLPIEGVSDFFTSNFLIPGQVASIGHTIALQGSHSLTVVDINDRSTREVIPFDETLSISSIGVYQGKYVVFTSRGREAWMVFYDPDTEETQEEMVISDAPVNLRVSDNTLVCIGGKVYVKVLQGAQDTDLHEYVPGQGLVNLGYTISESNSFPTSADKKVAITSYNSFGNQVILAPESNFLQTFSMLDQFGYFEVPTGIEQMDDKLLITGLRTCFTMELNNPNNVEVLAMEEDNGFSAFNILTSPTRLNDGTFLFTSQIDDGRRSTIWRTDGTMAGTQRLADLPWYDRYLAFRFFGSVNVPVASDFAAFSSTSGGLYFFDLESRTGYTYRPLANFGRVSEAYGKFFAVDQLGSSGTSVLRYYHPTPADNNDFGTVFWDANANGIFDPAEAPVATQAVTTEILGEDGSVQSFSDEQGQYLRPFVADAEYQISITPDACWESTTPESFLLSDSIATPNFGLRPVPGSAAATAFITSPTTRCGFTLPFSVQVKNTGCLTLTGLQADLILDPDVVVVSSTIEPNSVEDNALQWSIPELSVGESWRAELSLTMPNESRAGEVVEYLLNVFSADEDSTPLAEFQYAPTLRCAIDPNDKLVHPARQEESNSNYTQIDESLIYTIRFQNTGNDTAFNVRLEDQLDPALDIKTFTPLNASHPYRVELSDGGLLQVFFDDIFLPDSNVNYVASNGFFAFSIALDSSALDQVIPNTAGIYFDFNDPVITNTVTSTIVEFLDEDQDGFYFWDECDDEVAAINPDATEIPGNGIDENCDGLDSLTSIRELLPGTLSIFPNPTAGRLTLSYSLPDQLLVSLFDGRGRRCRQWTISQDAELDLSNLPAAVYQLHILDPRSGNFSSRRIVKR